jgi:hypothetical protein
VAPRMVTLRKAVAGNGLEFFMPTADIRSPYQQAARSIVQSATQQAD